MASNDDKPRNCYFCTNIPPHESYKCRFAHPFYSKTSEKVDVRRMICPFFLVGNCRNADNCCFTHVAETDIDNSYTDPLYAADFPLKDTKSKYIVGCSACTAALPENLYPLHYLNCPKISISEKNSAVQKNFFVYCELCKQLIISKADDDCFGLLSNCDHAFCYGCLMKRRKVLDTLRNREEKHESANGHELSNKHQIDTNKLRVPNISNPKTLITRFSARTSNPHQIDENGFCIPNLLLSTQTMTPITGVDTRTSYSHQIDNSGFCVSNMFNQSLQTASSITEVNTRTSIPYHIDKNGYCFPSILNPSLQTAPISTVNTRTSNFHQNDFYVTNPNMQPNTLINRVNTGISNPQQIGVSGFSFPNMLSIQPANAFTGVISGTSNSQQISAKEIDYLKMFKSSVQSTATIARPGTRTSNSTSEFRFETAILNQMLNTEGPTDYTCPKCGKKSEFIIPSKIFTKNDEEKENLLLLQKFRWKKIDCIRFEQFGKCEYGKSCYFMHDAIHSCAHYSKRK